MTDMQIEGKRGPGRPPLRSSEETRPPVEDHKARAAARLAEIRANKIDHPDFVDEFYVPPHFIPDGWSYEWKTVTVLGKEDPYYQTTLRLNGWSPVPAERHPELVPVGYDGASIVKKGLMLCERPMELTQEARLRDDRAAREAVAAKEAQLSATPQGTLPRDADPRVAPKLRKGYAPVEIPQE